MRYAYAEVNRQGIQNKKIAFFVLKNLIKKKQQRSVDASIHIVLIALTYGLGH